MHLRVWAGGCTERRAVWIPPGAPGGPRGPWGRGGGMCAIQVGPGGMGGGGGRRTAGMASWGHAASGYSRAWLFAHPASLSSTSVLVPLRPPAPALLCSLQSLLPPPPPWPRRCCVASAWTCCQASRWQWWGPAAAARVPSSSWCVRPCGAWGTLWGLKALGLPPCGNAPRLDGLANLLLPCSILPPPNADHPVV